MPKGVLGRLGEMVTIAEDDELEAVGDSELFEDRGEVVTDSPRTY